MKAKRVLHFSILAFCVILSISVIYIVINENNKEKASWPQGVYFYNTDAVVDSINSNGISVYCIAIGNDIVKGLTEKEASLYLINTAGRRYHVEYQPHKEPYQHYSLFKLYVTSELEESAIFNEAEIVCNGISYRHGIGQIALNRALSRLNNDTIVNIMFTEVDNSYCVSAYIENKSKHDMQFYGFSSDFNHRSIVGYLAANGSYLSNKYDYPLTIKSGETFHASILLEMDNEKDNFTATYYYPGAIFVIGENEKRAYASSTYSGSEVLPSHSADDIKKYVSGY